jgi:hypothetical protein
LATAPENCGEAIDLGIKTSRFVTLDPDGQSVKEEPILGFCEVPAGTTRLDTDVTVEVGKCHSLHCFQHNMTYAAPLQQMVALIEASGNCSQSIKVECQTAPLQVSSIKINRDVIVGKFLVRPLQWWGRICPPLVGIGLRYLRI